MRYLNTVYVRDHQARVGHRRGSLVVKQEAGTTRVPLAGIDALVLLGSGQVSSDALAACVKRGVRVASLRRSGAVRFVVGGPMSGNVHLRMAQHAAVLSEDHSLNIARAIVAAKLQSSRRMLLRWSRDAHDTSLRQRLVALLKRRQLATDHFVRTPGGAVYLGDEGRDTVLKAWEAHKATLIPHKILRRPVERWALPTVQATLLARHLRGDLSLYPPFVLP